MKKVAQAMVFCALLLGAGQASAQPGVRDKWGLRDQDWLALRANPFLERLSFDWKGRKEELIRAVLANDGKAQVIMALGLMTERIEWREGVKDGADPGSLLNWASKNGVVFADYLLASFAAPQHSGPDVQPYMDRLRKAVDAGHLAARQRLGAEYLRGEFVQRDVAKAESLIKSDHPDLERLAKYYEALVYLAYDAKRKDKPKAVRMLKQLADRKHGLSEWLLDLLRVQEVVGTHVKSFEVVKFNRPPSPIGDFDHEPCWSGFKDGEKREFKWKWEYIRISNAGTAGDLKFEGAGAEFFLKPTRPVNEGDRAVVLKLAKDLNEACKDFTYFGDEDGNFGM
jgi:hypothetical protein